MKFSFTPNSNNNSSQSDTQDNHAEPALYGEEVIDHKLPEKIIVFNQKLSKEDFIKQGFYGSITSQVTNYNLPVIIQAAEKHNDHHLEEVRIWYENRYNALRQSIKILEEKLRELNAKKQIFKNELDELLKSQASIEVELSELRKSLIEVYGKIAIEKQDIIQKRFAKIREELDLLVNIHQNLEDRLNNNIKPEDKTENKERILFLKKVKANWERSYNLINDRLADFEAAGVNSTVAGILVSIGLTGTLVAGWFFSLWTGPLPRPDSNGNIVDNKSILFLIIDSITRLPLKYSLTEIIFGSFAFILAVTVVSYLYYKLLIYFGFINDTRKQTRSFSTVDSIEFELNLSEQDDFFKSQFKGGGWFSFWLKLAPFFFFIFIFLPLLGMITLADQKDELQNAYDSLINQNFGTLICITISGIIFLYIIKIIEPRFSREKQLNNPSSFFRNNWELVITVILFLFLVALIILYRSRWPVFSDERKIFIVAFLVTSVVSGLCGGYGLRYRELVNNNDTYERMLSHITELIYRISTSVSFLNHAPFYERVAVIQNKMFQLVQGRTDLLVAMSNGQSYNIHENYFEENEPFEPGYSGPNKSILGYLFNTYYLLKNLKKLYEFFLRKSKNLTLKAGLTEEEKLFFPEIFVQAEKIRELIDDRSSRLKQIQERLSSYLKEEGTYKAITRQIDKTHSRIDKIGQKLLDTELEHLNYKNDNRQLLTRNLGFIHEGFNLGIWFGYNRLNHHANLPVDNSTDSSLPPAH